MSLQLCANGTDLKLCVDGDSIKECDTCDCYTLTLTGYYYFSYIYFYRDGAQWCGKQYHNSGILVSALIVWDDALELWFLTITRTTPYACVIVFSSSVNPFGQCPPTTGWTRYSTDCPDNPSITLAKSACRCPRCQESQLTTLTVEISGSCVDGTYALAWVEVGQNWVFSGTTNGILVKIAFYCNYDVNGVYWIYEFTTDNYGYCGSNKRKEDSEILPPEGDYIYTGNFGSNAINYGSCTLYDDRDTIKMTVL